MKIEKFRKRPVVIDAMRYVAGGFSFFDVKQFVGDALFPYMMNPGSSSLHIETLEGLMEVRDGDYIIKGVKGEFYPCKPDIFEMTYEKVEES